jgi:hypothetical protein
MPRCRPPEQPPWARGRRPPMPADHHGCGIHAARRSRSPCAAARPDAMAHIGLQRPRLGPAAMRHHDAETSPPAAVTTSRPLHHCHAPSLRCHTPPRCREPPPPLRPWALTMRRRKEWERPCPRRRRRELCPAVSSDGGGKERGEGDRPLAATRV